MLEYPAKAFQQRAETIMGLDAETLAGTDQKGIRPYAITGDETRLNIRMFSQAIREAKHREQGGIRTVKNSQGAELGCGLKFTVKETRADHIIPWSKGGRTEFDNCRLLCQKCNKKKSNR